MTEEEIQHILKYKTQWWNELRAIQKAEKGESQACFNRKDPLMHVFTTTESHY
jgi:hypothetical protein